DVVARAREGVEVVALDRMAVTQVIAQQQRGRHAIVEHRLRHHRLAVARVLEAIGAQKCHERPQPPHGQRNRGHQRAFAAHREVDTRPGATVRTGRYGGPVIDDVDAAAKGDAVVDHRQLAVQPLQQTALHVPPALGTVDALFYAQRSHLRGEPARRRAAAGRLLEPPHRSSGGGWVGLR
ncbi:MAG: hypothetical protein ACK56I_32850, partial [bacterium]